jgi:hypothetical protein
VEDRQLELVEPFRVGDHLDFGDLPARYGEGSPPPASSRVR